VTIVCLLSFQFSSRAVIFNKYEVELRKYAACFQTCTL